MVAHRLPTPLTLLLSSSEDIIKIILLWHLKSKRKKKSYGKIKKNLS